MYDTQMIKKIDGFIIQPTNITFGGPILYSHKPIDLSPSLKRCAH